jgi:hypothetical protein
MVTIHEPQPGKSKVKSAEVAPISDVGVKYAAHIRLVPLPPRARFVTGELTGPVVMFKEPLGG